MCDVAADVKANIDGYLEALQRVLLSGIYIGGEEVESLEAEICSYAQVSHAVTVASGTDALVLTLQALEIGVGDEVITPAFSFVATAESIVRVGARPVFADVEPDTYNLSIPSVESRLSARTVALLPVHMFGLPCDLDSLRSVAKKHSLALIEDCAHATGALVSGQHVGTSSTAGAFSFFPTKPLGGLGDGGVVTTNSTYLATRLRALRSHGGRKYDPELLGANSRLDAINAAFLRLRLPRLSSMNTARRDAYERYRRATDSCAALEWQRDSPERVFHQVAVRIGERRDAVQRDLGEVGISTAVHYPRPLNRMAPFVLDGMQSASDTPVTDRLCAEILSLPLWPEIPLSTIERISASLLQSIEGTP